MSRGMAERSWGHVYYDFFQAEIRFLEQRLHGLQQGGDSAAKAEAFKALHEARLRHYEQFKEFDASKDEKDTVEDAEEKGTVRGAMNRGRRHVRVFGTRYRARC